MLWIASDNTRTAFTHTLQSILLSLFWVSCDEIVASLCFIGCLPIKYTSNNHLPLIEKLKLQSELDVGRASMRTFCALHKLGTTFRDTTLCQITPIVCTVLTYSFAMILLACNRISVKTMCVFTCHNWYTQSHFEYWLANFASISHNLLFIPLFNQTVYSMVW